jgi:hypothetical protein
LVIVLADLVVAIFIVAIAAVLGLTVSPMLWIVAVFAILWLGGRSPRDPGPAELH